MIEEGIFVRTKRGIRKIEQIEGDKIIVDRGCFIYYKEDILKASYNIIDLIEEGDYVNGYKAIKIDDNNSSIRVDGFGWGTNQISYENITSIVTHEQFKNMEYKVKE